MTLVRQTDLTSSSCISSCICVQILNKWVTTVGYFVTDKWRWISTYPLSYLSTSPFSLSYSVYFLTVWHKFMFSKMSQNKNRICFFFLFHIILLCLQRFTTTSDFIYECSRSLLENKRLECDFLTCWMFSGKCRSKLKPWQSSDLGSSVGRELLCRGTKAEMPSLDRREEQSEWEAAGMLWNLSRGFWVNVHGWQRSGMFSNGEF